MLRASQHATPVTCRSRGAQWRRAFFNFPLPHNGSETQSYHERKILPYRRSDLYKVIAGVESYSNFLPYCTGSRILESNARQDGVTVMEAELTVDFLAFKESYISTVTCKPYVYVEAVASSSSPLFKTLTTFWRLQPVSSTSQLSTSFPQEISTSDRGPTLVTLDLTFAFANPMYEAVSATFLGQASKVMVKAFEQRCAALHGPRIE